VNLNIEFRKGLLFIRLAGILSKDTSKILSNCIHYFMEEGGVKYFVINLKELDYIDEEGLNLLKRKNKDIILHNGNLIICASSNMYVEKIVKEELSEVSITKDELKAFELIKVWKEIENGRNSRIWKISIFRGSKI